jgi:hypothetical protein
MGEEKKTKSRNKNAGLKESVKRLYIHYIGDIIVYCSVAST